MGGLPGAQAESALRLSGTVGANKVMESELLRLVMRSPFQVRVPKPGRQGSTTPRCLGADHKGRLPLQGRLAPS